MITDLLGLSFQRYVTEKKKKKSNEKDQIKRMSKMGCRVFVKISTAMFQVL